jgi:hypothetical protein
LGGLEGPLPEGEKVEVQVEHQGEWTSTWVLPERAEVKLSHKIFALPEPTESQKLLRARWLEGSAANF